jgi:hypothetical protein
MKKIIDVLMSRGVEPEVDKWVFFLKSYTNGGKNEIQWNTYNCKYVLDYSHKNPVKLGWRLKDRSEWSPYSFIQSLCEFPNNKIECSLPKSDEFLTQEVKDSHQILLG